MKGFFEFLKGDFGQALLGVLLAFTLVAIMFGLAGFCSGFK